MCPQKVLLHSCHLPTLHTKSWGHPQRSTRPWLLLSITLQSASLVSHLGGRDILHVSGPRNVGACLNLPPLTIVPGTLVLGVGCVLPSHADANTSVSSCPSVSTRRPRSSSRTWTVCPLFIKPSLLSGIMRDEKSYEDGIHLQFFCLCYL